MYQTSDFVEATVLQYTGHHLSFVDDSDKRAVFNFEMSFDTHQILQELRMGKIRVEPRAFYIAQKEMKDRLYNS